MPSNRRISHLLYIPLFLLGLNCAECTTFLRICSTRNSPEVRLVFNGFTQNYVVVHDKDGSAEDGDDPPPTEGENVDPLSTEEEAAATSPPSINAEEDGVEDIFDEGGVRHRRHLEISPAIQIPLDTARTSNSSPRRLKHVVEEIAVRRCHCTFEDTHFASFCESAIDTCGVDPAGNVGCFNSNSRTALIRNAWPVVILWYSALLLFGLCTEHGRNARQYVLNKLCCSSPNQRAVQQVMDGVAVRHQAATDFWLSRRRRTARIASSNGGGGQALALKTKIYVPPDHAFEDEDDNACTICFTTIEEGERVGNLPCKHTFHVDCLKMWLKRRNVCPLCQTPDIAEPKTTGSVDAVTSSSSIADGLVVDDGNGAVSPATEAENSDESVNNGASGSMNEFPPSPTPLINAEASMDPYDRFSGRRVLLRR